MMYKFLASLLFILPVVALGTDTAQREYTQLQPYDLSDIVADDDNDDQPYERVKVITIVREVEQEEKKPPPFLIWRIIKVYVIVCYIIMGWVALKFYIDYEKYAEQGEKIQKVFTQPSLSNAWGAFKITVDNARTMEPKIRDGAYLEKAVPEITMAFLVAPVSVPYYCIARKGEFPKF